MLMTLTMFVGAICFFAIMIAQVVAIVYADEICAASEPAGRIAGRS